MFRVFESGVPFTECFDADSNTCPMTADCRLRAHIARAVDAFYDTLDGVTLQDLVQGNCGLQRLLEMHPAATIGRACDRAVA
ncbi:hypothetical protein MASR1M32_07570 [Rhodobacter sp.]